MNIFVHVYKCTLALQCSPVTGTAAM